MKKIKFSLSSSSVNNAIKELTEYKNGINDKCQTFVSRLAKLGIPIIETQINKAHGDSDPTHKTRIELTQLMGFSQARLILDGKDILFIEFGAGVHYNGSAGSSPNPMGAKFGYTIGSYGEGRGKYDRWQYIAPTGEYVKSQGTQATMPMYEADKEIIRNIKTIAKQVFAS